MKQRVLDSKAVQTDDTPVAVLHPALPRTRTGRIWTYVGNHSYKVYHCAPNRSRDGPDAFLKELSGFLRAGAHSGYEHLCGEGPQGRARRSRGPCLWYGW